MEGALCLVQGLAEAHRMGLVHGRLGAETVTRQESPHLRHRLDGTRGGNAAATARGPSGPGWHRPRGAHSSGRRAGLGSLLAGWLPADRLRVPDSETRSETRTALEAVLERDARDRSGGASHRGGSRRAVERAARLPKTGPDRLVHDDRQCRASSSVTGWSDRDNPSAVRGRGSRSRHGSADSWSARSWARGGWGSSTGARTSPMGRRSPSRSSAGPGSSVPTRSSGSRRRPASWRRSRRPMSSTTSN